MAPPAEKTVIPAGNYDPSQSTSAETTASTDSAYVTEVTPFVFVTPTETKITYNTTPLPTATPKDIRCRIYTKSQTYLYNGSAFTFNLKNPPMLINYTVIPTNITEKRVVNAKTGSKAESVISIDTYSPNSWLEITIRNVTTGEIYQQDGFQKGHSTYLTNTLKVNKQGDLLIEIKGNLITASVNFWVKPEINFDDTQLMNSTVCTEIEQTRSSLAYVTATPNPTWTG
ncbi:MAG: hypothetical protein Q7T80_11075 [Methanoregula sp.]|nr:hypothetical protein [Methanoregula sp.]